MTNKIEFKPIKGYEGLYEVNSIGQVKSLIGKYGVKERILKGCYDTDGYIQVLLYKNKKRKSKKVHRLVLESFIENIDNKPSINHINGIKSDNRLENLEWATVSENTQHAYDNGLAKKGEGHSRSKKIIDLNTGIVFNCIKELSDIIGMKYSTLRGQINGCDKNKTSFIYL
jgi:hypothetical protein